MIRVVRVQEVMPLEGDEGMQAMLVLRNGAGMSVELPVSVEQMAVIVRLHKADSGNGVTQADSLSAPEVPVEVPQPPPPPPVPQPAQEFVPPGPPPGAAWELEDEPDVPGEVTGVGQF